MKNTAADFYKILQRAREQINEVARKNAPQAARSLLDNVLSLLDGFSDVTGNTRTGIAVGVYLDGKLQSIVTSKEVYGQEAFVAQLRKGEKYPFSITWSGESMRKKYSGEVNTSGKFASAEAIKFLIRKKPVNRVGWAFIVVSAADYSKYIEVHKRGNILTETRDLLDASGAWVSEVKSSK